MKSLYIFISLALLASSVNCYAETSFPIYKDIDWEERTYSTVLSKPFEEIEVHISTVPSINDPLNYSDYKIIIDVLGTQLLIDSEYFMEVIYLSEPDIATDELFDSQNEEITEFEILFEHGIPYRVGDGEDFYWARDIVSIVVNRDLNVSVENFSFK